jgi:hypothetical protein
VKVSAAAEKLAYGRGYATSSPAATHTLTVGVVGSDIQNPFYPELLDVLQTELGFLGIQGFSLIYSATADASGTADRRIDTRSGAAIGAPCVTVKVISLAVIHTDIVREGSPMIAGLPSHRACLMGWLGATREAAYPSKTGHVPARAISPN